MFNINYKSQRPIYEQIVEQAIMYMMEGVLQSGDQLPSIRELSASLGINPNTVSKAYGELEKRGYIETVVGKGSFVSSTHHIKKDIQNLYKEQIKTIFDDMLQTGFTREIIVHVVDSIFKEEDYVND